MSLTFIYALCEPGTRTVRYIGKSRRVAQRFSQHLRTKAKTHLGFWIRKVVAGGEKPNLVVIREVPGDGSEAEIEFIRLARGLGIRLVNSTDGGDGITMTPETRKKIGDKSRGRKLSEEAKKNISEKNTGKKWTSEQREAQSHRQTGSNNPMFGKTGQNSPLFGRSHPPAQCKAISDAYTDARRVAESSRNTGSGNPMFGRTGEKSPHFGVPKTPEHRKALSESYTEVRRAAQILAQTGRKHTEETKALQSEARRASWARRKERDQEIEWALAPYTLE